MFHIGYQEMAIIVVAAIVILRPERLPEAVRMIGRLLRGARRLTDRMRMELGETLASLESEAPPKSSPDDEAPPKCP